MPANAPSDARPSVRLSRENGNVFNLLAVCTRALRRAGQPEAAKALAQEVMASGSYGEALQAMMRACRVS